jgi:hypothetical protein
MSNDRENEKKRREEQERLLRQLQQLVYNNYLSMLNITGVKNVIRNGNSGFFFSHNNTANKAVDQCIEQMAKQMNGMLLNGIDRSWKQGQENFWDKLKLTFSQTARDKKTFDRMREQATDSARNKTAASFWNEKRNGLNISDRVWNLAKNSKKEMEIIIQNGIKEGKSAEAIQKSLKGYLNEPDMLFRRVRNKETGELELSKAAQKYKPGRGVYRSAYANAMRLARTEISAAYNQAQWEMFQNEPSITGFRIVLSNNHTTLINGVPVPFKDICDKLQGVYPKTFKWTHWHPQCRCTMIPVTVTREERKDLYKSIFDGKRDEWKPKQITEIPKAFTEWVNENQERAKGWSNMPRFVKDNAQFVKTKFQVNIYSDEEKKFTQSRKTQAAMQRVIDQLAKLYPDIPNTELAAIHHYTRSGGNYRQLNRQLDKGTLTDFNSAAQTLIVQGLEKAPVYKGAVYRGMIIKRKEFERAFGDVGSTVRHNRFVSSSMDNGVAYKFATWSDKMNRNEIKVMIEIQSKNGRDISGISEFNGIFASENQKEVLFTNNTAFEIVSKSVRDDGVIELKMIEK